jgi:hypothetical protein
VETGEELTRVRILPRDPRVLKVVVFGQIREAFNCSGWCTPSWMPSYARKYEKSV